MISNDLHEYHTFIDFLHRSQLFCDVLMGHPGEVAATSPELLTQEQGSGQRQIPVVQSRWMQTEVVFCACSCIRNCFNICTDLCAMEIKVDICVHSARFLAGFGCSEGLLETLNAPVAYECQVHQTGTGDFCSTATREHLGPQVRKTRENQVASCHMMTTLWWQGVSRMHETASNSKKSRLPWHWPMERERERDGERNKSERKKERKKEGDAFKHADEFAAASRTRPLGTSMKREGSLDTRDDSWIFMMMFDDLCMD